MFRLIRELIFSLPAFHVQGRDGLLAQLAHHELAAREAEEAHEIRLAALEQRIANLEHQLEGRR